MSVLNQPLCTGCSACVASCPFKALTMGFDDKGFYRPQLKKGPSRCTNCETCTRVCPLNSKIAPMSTNRQQPPCFALETDEKTSFASSNAGGFQVIAKSFLSQSNSVVIGAAWDGLTVKHILVDNLKDLPKLYKSKYAQSFMGDIFSRAKSALENGQRVLFSGTPCQIAGLFSYLTNQSRTIQDTVKKNLYTIEVFCHYVPPAKVFTRYLEETFGKDKLLSCDFRAKEEGHAFGYKDELKIKYQLKDKTHQYSSGLVDLYYHLFLSRVMMGEQCQECKFSGYPRCGDVTLVDFWKIERSDPKFQGGRTEAVLINNSKGDFLARSLKQSATKWEQKSLEVLHYGNPFASAAQPRQPHPRRDRFFSYLKTMSVTSAGRASLNDAYDIGLIGMPFCKNCGATLTSFALFKVLQDLGKSVLLISPPLNSYEGNKYRDLTGWDNPPYHEYDLAQQTKTIEEMRKLNDKCEMFLVGSDQLFATKGLYESTSKVANLSWVFDYKKKAAYAASFGNSYLTCLEPERAEMGYYLSQFDYFSVREKSGVELCKREFNIKTDWVLDPVFLCDVKTYESFLLPRVSKKPILACYVMSDQDELGQIIKDVAAHQSLYPVIMEGAHRAENTTKVEDWLTTINQADLVVTDSFHGVCFSLIFQRPFIAVCDKPNNHQNFRTSERMRSILEFAGLPDRLVYSYAQYEKIRGHLHDINWDSVNAKLEKAKKNSFAALKKAITPLKKNMSGRDIEWLKEAAWEQEFRWEIGLHKFRYRLHHSRYFRAIKAVVNKLKNLGRS